MKLIKNFYIILTMAALTSCGELFNFEEAKPAPLGIALSHHEVDIIVGDTIILDTYITPDTVEVSYHWEVYDDVDAVQLVGRRVYANKSGRAKIVVEATGYDAENNKVLFTDSCFVNVFEWKECNPAEYLYETVVYASLMIDNELMNDSLGDTRLVAIVDGEVRGEAVMREAHAIPYLEMRIAAAWPGESAQIQCYHKAGHERFVFETRPLHGGTYGTLSKLRSYKTTGRKQ